MQNSINRRNAKTNNDNGVWRNAVPYFKMSIYLYGIMPNDIKNIWIKASSCCLNIIKVITDEYLGKKHIPVVTKVNLGDIYQTLDTLVNDEKIHCLKLRCSNADMYQRTLSSLNEIWI